MRVSGSGLTFIGDQWHFCLKGTKMDFVLRVNYTLVRREAIVDIKWKSPRNLLLHPNCITINCPQNSALAMTAICLVSFTQWAK